MVYLIPHMAPEALVTWVRKIVRNQEPRLCQMDPLSSPNELSPLHKEDTPLMWMTPADMKLLLRAQDEATEEVWKKAITILCYVVAILRECCELTAFRQTSFGSTYMTLLGFARVLTVSANVANPSDDMSLLIRKSREG